MERKCLTIILAAGAGTRMKSPLPKVLHPVAGLPMVGHVVRCAQAAGSTEIAIVTGHGGDLVRETLAGLGVSAETFTQEQQLGTGHAVLSARAALERGADDVLVMFGDTPLVEPETLAEARSVLVEGADLVVIGFRPADPTGYGRLVEEDGRLVAIVEHKDASDEQRKIGLCNGGLMAFAGKHLPGLLDEIGNANAKGEYYLTDAVAIAHSRGLMVKAIEAPVESVIGVNTRVELAEVEAIWQARARKRFMLAGVSMIAPETVFFHHDTAIGGDVSIEPQVFFGPGVSVADGARIRAYCHLEGASIGPNVEIGPFARLRPGAKLADGAKVGNFCEVKNADVAAGAKINHLTYVGDAKIGTKANIGAGTITCNYDGYNKHLTEIGAGAFIGSNSALVAPVKIGDGAYVASGSVVTTDVPDDAVAFARAKQVNKPGLATRLRERFAAMKDARKKG